MPIKKISLLKSFRYLCLIFFFVVGLFAIVASGGGGDGDSGSSDNTGTHDTNSGPPDNTNDDTSTDSDYGNTEDYTGPSFSGTAYDLTGATDITLNGNSITVSGTGASVSGSIVTITAIGTYNITGALNDGQVIVDTLDDGDVSLYFNGVDITCDDGPPVDIENAERVIIALASGKNNYLTDGSSYTTLDEDGEPDAALFSHEDLVIYGAGSLTVDANYMDGIKSKDGLIIHSGAINVTSADDGIIGKNYVSVEDCNITIIAGGDGLKSTDDPDDEDEVTGYIYVKDGFFDIDAGADAVQVETHIVIDGGEFELYTAGGSGNYYGLGEEDTAKGLKSPVGITIYSGIFTIDTADDAIHSNDTIVINGGEFNLASGDDAIHADLAATVNNGDIDVSTCYEGIEAAVITINDGDMDIIATDDGINVAGGVDASGTGGRGGRFPGDEFREPTEGQYLYINGGYIVIDTGSYLDTDGDGDSDSGGDGIDINGSVTMKGGVLIVNSTSDSYDSNGALDYDGGFTITGGFIIGAGSSAMAQVPGGQSSTQYSVLINLDSIYNAGTLFHIEKADGTEIVTFAPADPYNSVAFSSPDLGTGNYVYSIGGSSTGTETNGLYEGGTYGGGTDASFTISSITTTIGSGGGFPPPM